MTRETGYIPDFCTPRNTLVVALLAELVALLMALSHEFSSGAFWRFLALTSLFLQWLALSSAALLCLLRRPLARLPARHAGILAYLLLIAITVLLTEAAWQVGAHFAPGLFPVGHGAFLLRTLLVSAIASGVLLRYFYVQSQWKARLEAETRARIDALTARIRPHFLFNSMNTIAALIRSDPAGAEEAVEDLADLFRASLADAQTQTSLREELDITRLYVRLEQRRLGERLKLDWQLADLPAEARVPLLTLQPLVENAIYHGIEPLPGGGTVIIRGHCEGERLCLEVENPLADATRRGRRGNRLALDNIRQRLALAFDSRASLDVLEVDSRYRVTLNMPLVTPP